MSEHPQITGASWLSVATLGLVWGGSFMLVAVALRGIGPFWLAETRLIIATLALGAVWLMRGRRLFAARPGPRGWAILALIGATNTALPFMLLSWGQQHVPSAFAGVSMATVPLIVLPLAHLFIPGERMTPRRLVGFGIGFAGVVVLLGGQAFASTGAALENWGRLACVGAASCYALTSILIRRLPPVDRIGLTAVLMLIGALIVLPVALMAEGRPPAMDRDTLLVVLALGLVSTALMALLQVTVIRTAGPVFLSLTNYQVPVWSVILGAAVLNEALPPSLLLALALILCGVGLSQYGALRRLFARTSSRAKFL